MEKCWERRGCDEEMQGRCPHNMPGEPCPSECNFAACVRKTHVVTDDLDLILNHWTLEHFDDMAARRLDIMFHNECHFGETVALRVAEGPGSCPSDICEIVKPDGTRAVSARILWRPCETR